MTTKGIISRGTVEGTVQALLDGTIVIEGDPYGHPTFASVIPSRMTNPMVEMPWVAMQPEDFAAFKMLGKEIVAKATTRECLRLMREGWEISAGVPPRPTLGSMLSMVIKSKTASPSAKHQARAILAKLAKQEGEEGDD